MKVEEGQQRDTKERKVFGSILIIAAERSSLEPAGGIRGLMISSNLPKLTRLQLQDLQRHQDRKIAGRQLPTAEYSSLSGCLHNCMQHCMVAGWVSTCAPGQVATAGQWLTPLCL